ncbi:MAG TPA: cobalamin-dependent protein, partial [archaeon]|nr:cobalamin-dependent protein [archaeon]
MKFAFIHTGIDVEISATQREKAPASWPPLGILYVATFLRDNGVEVSVLDQAAKGLSLKDTVSWVKRDDPDILGFSTLSCSGKTAAKIAKLAKEENPNLKIVFGNYHATFNAERILKKYPFVDAVVEKEGELTALELAESIEKGADLDGVHGIYFRKNGRIVSTPERPLEKNIDFLPFPDRGLLDVEYRSTMFGLDLATERFTTVLTSRGCPYRCSFCGCMKIAHGVWRPRSVENVLGELKMLEDKGYRQVLFVDDNYTVNKKRLFELCQRMRAEKIDLEWICESRVDNCSTEMIRFMVK